MVDKDRLSRDNTVYFEKERESEKGCESVPSRRCEIAREKFWRVDGNEKGGKMENFSLLLSPCLTASEKLYPQ